MKRILIFCCIIFSMVIVAMVSFQAGRKECGKELKSGDLYSHLNTYLRSYEDLRKAGSLSDLDDVKVRLLLASSAIAGHLNNNPTLIEEIANTSPQVRERLSDVQEYVEEMQTKSGEH